jgi:hypothetical protein
MLVPVAQKVLASPASSSPPLDEPDEEPEDDPDEDPDDDPEDDPDEDPDEPDEDPDDESPPDEEVVPPSVSGFVTLTWQAVGAATSSATPTGTTHIFNERMDTLLRGEEWSFPVIPLGRQDTRARRVVSRNQSGRAPAPACGRGRRPAATTNSPCTR